MLGRTRGCRQGAGLALSTVLKRTRMTHGETSCRAATILCEIHTSSENYPLKWTDKGALLLERET